MIVVRLRTEKVVESIEGEPLPGVTILRAAQVAMEACGTGLKTLAMGVNEVGKATLRIEWVSFAESPLPGSREVLLQLMRSEQVPEAQEKHCPDCGQFVCVCDRATPFEQPLSPHRDALKWAPGDRVLIAFPELNGQPQLPLLGTLLPVAAMELEMYRDAFVRVLADGRTKPMDLPESRVSPAPVELGARVRYLGTPPAKLRGDVIACDRGDVGVCWDDGGVTCGVTYYTAQSAAALLRVVQDKTP